MYMTQFIFMESKISIISQKLFLMSYNILWKHHKRSLFFNLINKDTLSILTFTLYVYSFGSFKCFYGKKEPFVSDINALSGF